ALRLGQGRRLALELVRSGLQRRFLVLEIFLALEELLLEARLRSLGRRCLPHHAVGVDDAEAEGFLRPNGVHGGRACEGGSGGPLIQLLHQKEVPIWNWTRWMRSAGMRG